LGIDFRSIIGEDKAKMPGSAALLREQIQSTLGSHYETVFLTRKQPAEEALSSIVGEIPRGTITEIAGPAFSGRTSLLYSLLATASAGQEFCAFLDAGDTFNPESAAASGVRLSQVLWVRCGGNLEHALKAADLLAHAGGFGLVAIDFGDASAKIVRRIPIAVWFRLRQAVENTRTALLVVAQQIHAHPCSTFKIELSRSRSLWRGQLPGCLLDGLEATAQCVRNHRAQERRFIIAR
jgi:recombination protein RecA